MNVVFAGGGTGGHLYPGLALAEELRRREPDSRLLFLCTARDADDPGLQAEGIETTVLPSRSHGPLPLRLAAMVPAVWRAFGLLRAFRPDAVVGLGGYGSVAPVLCARVLRVPVLLLEQNVVPGRTNRMLVRLAAEVASQWEEAVPRFPCRRKVRVTGNPIRTRVRRADRGAAAAALGIDPHVPALLVMGGSQGSSPVNDAMLGALPLLSQREAPMQIVHLTGRHDADAVRAAYAAAGARAVVFDFVEDMAAAYSACDLTLCRAGGTSIAELTALGVPAIFVPLPHAKDNHQHLNASVLESRGAAVLLEQRTLTADQLAGCIADLMDHPDRLAAMASAMRSLGRPRAAAIVADRVVALARPRGPAVAAAGQA
ncbi:undecaprenyldiphospho-muramoylpentapeptide beta-N-acetylglucosaminyltransferase [bacterium]|nr:undecaprenyldiphospho-muramoylpentapeptide beta-N-acetylglucosaminyltransferase [bacterium]